MNVYLLIEPIPIYASAEEVEMLLSNLTSVPLVVAMEIDDEELVMMYTVIFQTYEGKKTELM